ncbi:MAG: NAD-dependent epimerase/dehydratase family protein, partial [Merismopediaceae bacterium]|nr:NAD-dependent epimerase/dehydratase family protein [Merismopediaceae bacterium]
MKILITGGTGFLGTMLCHQLAAQGHELVKINSKNCDLTQADSLLAFNHQTYDQIYHLAAWTQAGDFCLFHPGEQWLINQKINTHVLDWW